jgi:hypothetical protein
MTLKLFTNKYSIAFQTELQPDKSKATVYLNTYIYLCSNLLLNLVKYLIIRSVSHDRSTASSKAGSSQSAI